MLKKLLGLLGDALIYGVGSILGQLIGFFLLPLYTERLSPSDYGITAMLSIVAGLFPAIAFTGMKSSIFRYFNLNSDPDERGKALGIGFIVVGISTLTLLTASLLCTRLLGRALFGVEEHLDLLRMSLLSAAANTIGGVPLLVLQAARRPKQTTSLNLCKTLFSVGLTVWLVVGRNEGVRGVVVGALVADAVFMVAQIALTRSFYRFVLDRPLLRRMLVYGLPFLPYRLLVIGTDYFSMYMVRQLMGLDDAGLYSVAMRFALPITFIVAALTQAWWPYRFKVFSEDADPASFFRTTVTYYVAAIGYLWVGVVAWGPEAIRLLTNERFHAAAFLVPAVGLIPVLQGFYQLVGTGLEIGEDTRAVPLVSLAGFVAVALATVLLIPRFGATGAALSASLGWTAMAASMYVLAQRRYRIEYEWRTLAMLGALALICAASGYAIQRLGLSYRVGYALLVSLLYPLAAFQVLHGSPIEHERMQILRDRLTAKLQRRRHV